ncbi:MAG: transporter substrate-binding domain-containing protein [Rhodospirillaceae bacterium]|nr:transporter substrate-binding domain-containing protein [Rhodospirillaceae bacterium]MBT4487014.1 transporter substrate-binding domain-containing protein [Rhodospirillaceae bacterium]
MIDLTGIVRFCRGVSLAGALFGVFTSSIVLAAGEVTLTDAEKAWLGKQPVVRVHNETNWPPFNFAEDGQAKGYSIDFMNLVAGKTGLKVEYVTGPSWSEFLRMMKSGDLDVMLNIVKTPERLKYLAYTRPYADNPNTILSKRDASYDSLEQLDGKTISIPKGFFYEEILQRDYPGVKLHLVKGTLDSMKAVTFGKADAALGELAVFNHLLGRHLMTDLVVSGEVKMGSPEFALLNMASRKDQPLLAAILDKGIKAVTLEETRAIQRKWLGETRAGKSQAKTLHLTEAEKAWLKAHGDLRFGFNRNYPPFEYAGPKGEFTGIASGYIDLLNKRLGLRMTPVPGLEWPQVIAGVKDRTLDIAPAMTSSAERKKSMLFTKTHLKFPRVILTRQDFEFVAGPEDLIGRRVAQVRDFVSNDTLNRKYPGIVAHDVDTSLQAILAVSHGEADAVILNLAVASHLLQRENITNIKVAAPSGLDLPGPAIAVRGDWPELVAILDKALASITPEEHAAIRSKWIAVRFEHVVDTSELIKVALGVGAGALVILVVIVVWNRRLTREIQRHHETQRELAAKEALLRLSLDQMSDGLFQIDQDLKYVLYNDRYKDLLSLPDNLVEVGKSIEMAIRHLVLRGDYGDGDPDQVVEKRLTDYRQNKEARVELKTPDGVVEIRQMPTMDGGMVAVVSDVTEHKKAEDVLRAAKEDAEASAQAKSDFVAVVSHEVRTPMNGVLGMARLMLETPLMGEQRDYAQTIVESGESLLTILNDLLDISKLEAGMLEVESFAFSPSRMIADTANVMRPRAVEKNLKTSHRNEPGVPAAVMGDGNRLRQIVFNLLSNAIKFTDRGEVEIIVEARHVDEASIVLSVTVRDTGPGIAPEAAEQLFAPYVQANIDVARKYGGTGLGLSISRRLAELMGGEISLQSTVGEGSAFTIKVPFDIAEEAPREAEKQVAWASNGGGPGLRVLLVEDNRINRKVAEGMLAKLGHKSVFAENGREALEILEASDPFDAILMDRHMPVMDGIEATRRIRAMDNGVGAIPIIAVTAAATQREVETCLEAGMNDVVTKPIDPGQLEIALRRAVSNDREGALVEKPIIEISEVDQPVLDLKVVDALYEDYGRENALELIDMFREVGQENLEGYLLASKSDDVGQMTYFAHDLKSSAANVGLSQLSGLCREIEVACDDGRLEDARTLGENLSNSVAQAMDALDSLAD